MVAAMDNATDETTAGSPMERLRKHLAEISDVEKAAGVLGWDQQTYMPPGGAEHRADQLATLSRISHTWFTGDATRQLLDAAAPDAEREGPDSDNAAIVRRNRREYEISRKLPNDFVAEMTHASILSNEAWQKARRTDDFPLFQPHLEKMVDFARRSADLYGYDNHPYDALLNLYEPEMTAAEAQAIFDVLRPAQVAMVKAIAGKPKPRTDFLERDYPESGQENFGLKVVQDFGYDLSRGRLDIAPHPFETDFGRNDVRITTRYDRHMPSQAIYAIFHESGHAMYEQNVNPKFSRTLLDSGASMVFHESQSRLWENVIGRSRSVITHYFPLLQETFAGSLSDVNAEEFYKAVNVVEPSLIRVEADEVTYNLHIMLRFELEMSLIAGDLQVKDLPDAWNAKMQEYLGITPPNNADGVMQDTHWSSGSLGYFPTYALGNVMGAQIYATAVKAHPEIPAELAEGRFGTLFTWLVENLYTYGRKYMPRELALKVNGAPLDPQPYLAYLKAKYGDIYAL
jgi:carboxypeptidase Taq